MNLDAMHQRDRGLHTVLPLRQFRIVDTARAEEAEHILSRELNSLRIMSTADRSQFRLQMNGTVLGAVLIGFNRFGVHTRVNPGRLEDTFIFSFGHEKPSVLEVDSSSMATTPTSGVMLSPYCRLLIDRSADSGMFLVRTSPTALENHLRILTGRRVLEPLRFSRQANLSAEPGATVLRLVHFVISELEEIGPMLGDSPRRTALQDLLLAAILTLPNNYSDDLNENSRGQISRQVVRVAEEFMQAQIGESISIADILAICGCSRSVLFEAFHRYRNHTPMQFVTKRRMEKARGLLRSSSGENVTSVAYDCGFTHLGRFAGAYRARYGEAPSETIRRWSPVTGEATGKST